MTRSAGGNYPRSIIIQSEFIFETATFPSCHAATLVETQRGTLLASFFGGLGEGRPDASIWITRSDRGLWTEPVQIADGLQPDGWRFPCWNPVLFQPRDAPLMLFYKVGPSPSKWWGMLRTSENDGLTWSAPTRLPPGNIGPAKNKPVQLADGLILLPSSLETEDRGWCVCFIASRDGGRTWSVQPPVEQPAGLKATQPSLLIHSDRVVQAVGRTTSKRMFQTWSEDGGQSWSPIELIDLPNCNSGIDAVTLRDGRHLLVYNHSNVEKVRYPLNVAVSEDGRTWHAALALESAPPGQYSYPAVIQTSDGLVHIAYTWKRRRIKHVILDPARLPLDPIETFRCLAQGTLTHRVDPFQ